MLLLRRLIIKCMCVCLNIIKWNFECLSFQHQRHFIHCNSLCDAITCWFVLLKLRNIIYLCTFSVLRVMEVNVCCLCSLIRYPFCIKYHLTFFPIKMCWVLLVLLLLYFFLFRRQAKNVQEFIIGYFLALSFAFTFLLSFSLLLTFFHPP